MNENEDISFQWSTGETTEDIVVEIEETTEFWVDVTVNSLTCRETITIISNAPPAPTGNLFKKVVVI